MRYLQGNHVADSAGLAKPDPQASSCTKIHASDLDKWIKTHPESIQDEHAKGWNDMYNAFVSHARTAAEPARLEAEAAAQAAKDSRKEENMSRSTKEKGRMATLGANKNIGHQVKGVELNVEESFSDRISARVERARERLTRATKGRALGDA